MMDRGMFFELPKTEISGLPLELEGERLNIGLVEIGCMQKKKRKQLKLKRELIYKFWGDNYYGSVVDWYPKVYRTLGHYDCAEPSQSDSNYNVDTTIRCEYFPDTVPIDRRRVSKKARKRNLEDILHDHERLYDLVCNGRETYDAAIRGSVAEVYMLQMIEDAIPENILMQSNQQITFGNRRYPEGTEIDAIMFFYGHGPYAQFVENLKCAPYLKVGCDEP